jgi:hypothetical protein
VKIIRNARTLPPAGATNHRWLASGRRAIEEIIMTRAKYFLLPAICALAFTAGTPAMALNPQPLPPGFKQPPTFQASKYFARKAGGSSEGASIFKGNRWHGQ